MSPLSLGRTGSIYVSVRPHCTPHVAQATSTIHGVGSSLHRDHTGPALTTGPAELHIVHIACVGGTATLTGYCLTSVAANARGGVERIPGNRATGTMREKLTRRHE